MYAKPGARPLPQIKAAGVTDTPFVHEVASYKTEFWLTGAQASIVDNDNGRSAPATRATLSDNAKALELFDWFAQMEADGLLLPNGDQIRFTVSLGVAGFRPGGPLQSADGLLHAADSALYRAKADGRNRVALA